MAMELRRHRQVSVTESVIYQNIIECLHVTDTIAKGLGIQKGNERGFLLSWSLDPSGRDKCVHRKIR